MNTSSSFECGLSVVTQEKGQQGNREFPERDLPVGRPDPAQREVKQYKNWKVLSLNNPKSLLLYYVSLGSVICILSLPVNTVLSSVQLRWSQYTQGPVSGWLYTQHSAPGWAVMLAVSFNKNILSEAHLNIREEVYRNYGISVNVHS